MPSATLRGHLSEATNTSAYVSAVPDRGQIESHMDLAWLEERGERV